jgi:hypothetical protein
MNYMFFNGGVVAFQATPQAFHNVANVVRNLGDDGARFFSAKEDAQAVLDLFKHTMQSNGIEGVKVVGAALYGAAFTAGLAAWLPWAGGAAVAVVGGWAAGKFFEKAFDLARESGRRAWADAQIPTPPSPIYTSFPDEFEEFDFWSVPGMQLPNQCRPNDAVNTHFRTAKNPPRDPLALDLDGDGIETVGINPQQPILFDSDADGVKTATGWVRPDDGLLVLDLNGNGTIDSGRELFGDATLIPYRVIDTAPGGRGEYEAMGRARDGFAALAARDANADGQINASDEVFAQLRVWQDLNQDGISQAAELQTLNALGISSIGVVGTSTNVNLGNGNTESLAGSYTRTNGSTAQVVSTSQQTANLLLDNNPFYSQFTDNPASTAAAQALPQMQGAGRVRDLRSAMSLGTPLAAELQAAVAGFAAGGSRGVRWFRGAGCGRKCKQKMAPPLYRHGVIATEFKSSSVCPASGGFRRTGGDAACSSQLIPDQPFIDMSPC